MGILLRSVIIAAIFPSAVCAQDTLLVSREQLLRDAADKNRQVEIARQSYMAAEAGYQQTKAIYLPNINVTYTAITTSNPLMAFGSKINQEAVSMADFNPALINDPGNIQNFSPKLEVQQPLLNYDAVYQRKAARAKADALKLKMERSAEYISFELEKAYMQLQMTYKVLDVLQKARQTVLANKKTVTDYYNNGMLQKTELLNMDVRVTEIDNQLQYAASAIHNASDYLNFLLNDASGSILKPSDTLAPDLATSNTALLNTSRKDLVAYSKSLEAYNNMAISAKKKFLPRLNAFGSYEFNDSKFYKARGEGYLLGIQLAWNVFDGYKTRGSIQQAQAEYRMAEQEFTQYKSQSQLEVNKTIRQLNDAANKIQLARQAVQQLQEAYRIRNNRFGQGLEKAADMLTAEMMVTQKQLELQQAVLEYNITSSYLRFLNK